MPLLPAPEAFARQINCLLLGFFDHLWQQSNMRMTNCGRFTRL